MIKQFAVLLFALSVSASLMAESLKVAVVNYPLQYFVERIGGESVEVMFLAPIDIDPAFWRPTPGQVTAYQQADLIMLNGADYAKWVKKVSLPRAKLVNTAKAYRDQLIVIHGPSHNHGPEGEHSHAGTAFTTWLDFSLAAKQVDAIAAALIRKTPEHTGRLEANTKALKDDLAKLDQTMQQLGEKLQGKSFVASHPVYQYFARRYQLDITELMWEPEMTLRSVELSELQTLISAKSIQWMIWEGAPSEDNRQKLSDRGVNSLVISPQGNVPEEGDWLLQMKSNIKALEAAL